MWRQWKQKAFITYWNPFLGILLLAILSVYYFGLLHKHWAVTGELTRWAGEIALLFGIDVHEWEYFKIIGFSGGILDRIEGVMVVGMLLGALSSSLCASAFSWIMPRNRVRLVQSLFGGILAGFGARLGMGCNLASFFTGIPQFSLHAWIFTLVSLVGIYIGIQVIQMPFLQSKAKLKKGPYIPQEQPKQKNTFLAGIVILLLSFMFALSLGIRSNVNLAIATLFGVVFGFIIARAQICFTSAFRDLFLMQRGQVARALVCGMLLSTLGIFTCITLGVAPKISWAGLNAALGGLLFGFGIVIAGGCECGWMYRAMRGQIQFFLVGIGNLIGSLLLAYVWDVLEPILVAPFPKINLLETFGKYGGLVLNYILLLLLLGLIYWIEVRRKKI